MAVTTPRNVTYILNVDGYHIGDGVQLAPDRAAVVVADGSAVYSEEYVTPKGILENVLESMQADIDGLVLRVIDLENPE
jgi:hypothetical protein